VHWVLWAHKWINHWSLWRMASATPDLRLPSQPYGITALWSTFSGDRPGTLQWLYLHLLSLVSCSVLTDRDLQQHHAVSVCYSNREPLLSTETVCKRREREPRARAQLQSVCSSTNQQKGRAESLRWRRRRYDHRKPVTDSMRQVDLEEHRTLSTACCGPSGTPSDLLHVSQHTVLAIKNIYGDYRTKRFYKHKKHLRNVGPIRHNEPPHANSPDVATVLSHAACASMSTTPTTTTRDRGARYGPMEWAQPKSSSS